MQINLGGVEDLIPPVAQFFGVEPSTVLLFLAITVTAANLIGRLIPDDAVGWLGTIRKIAKTIGLFIPNRIAPGIGVDAVAKAVIADKLTKLKREVPSESKAELREQVPPPEGIKEGDPN